MSRYESLHAPVSKGIETQPFQYTDPSTICWEPRPSILNREAEVTRIQKERPRSTWEDL